MAVLGLGMLLGMLQGELRAQQAPATVEVPEGQVPSSQLPQSQGGTILFSTEQGAPVPAAKPGTAGKLPEVTAAERDAPTFVSYDLDLHLVPARASMTMRSRLVVRNDGAEPLRYLALQLSSSLTWESLELGGKPATWGQHLIDTDADHTGKANEAIVTLPQPLAVGASVEVTAFYSGEIRPETERLERIGAPPEKAAEADWDEISPAMTALRGFGNVLWYPTASEPAFLGDGAKLFQTVGRVRQRQQQAKIHLRLSVEYVGDAPDAAYFCGRRAQLKATSENTNVPVAESPGLATADFETQPLGFRSPSLFVTDRAATVTDDMLIAAVTDHYDTVPRYAESAALVKPLLTEWLGSTPLSQLTILDHPGQPFEDGAFLVLPMHATSASTLAPALVHTLAHAWFHSSQVWLDEGVPQFLSLLWTEQSDGRDAAITRLQQDANPLSLVEPEIPEGATGSEAGQSLVAARDEVYYRTKAAAVLWMLRSVAGDDALKFALRDYGKDTKRDQDPMGFELLLEQFAHKDLRWFFDDWVYHDLGLPDLTIVNVTPRQLPAQGGRPAGYLVSVEVRNDGAAVAEVPVTVRSGALTATERLRVPGHSSKSTRILFEGVPAEAVVNDGTVPEMRTRSHSMQINRVAQP
jgi:hypothetical protein